MGSKGSKGIAVVLVIVLITTGAIIFVDYFIPLPSPESSPIETVENFAEQHSAGGYKACYYLMSSEFKDSTSEEEFERQLTYCSPPWPYYKVLDIRKEQVYGNKATVEIEYIAIEEGIYQNMEPESKVKTVELVKEKEGWKLKELYCELRK